AYRYFSTDKRKFIIADTPGHEQYTRNMATGASTASLAVILIDARYGVQTQTRRHSFIADLLGIQHLVIAVNKMDLVDFSQARFDEIVADYRAFAEKLAVQDIRCVPISALQGDNVVDRSQHIHWYAGPALLELLERIEITPDQNSSDVRLPVQYVNRPHLDFRGYCGTLAAGTLGPGQAVKVLPSGNVSTIERIVTFDGDLELATPGQAITVTLNDEIDVSRGDLLVGEAEEVALSDTFEADIVWMHEIPLAIGRHYDIKLGTREAVGQVSAIDYQIDVNTLAHRNADHLGLNAIGRCRLELTAPLPVDDYHRSPGTGSFIVIDRLSNVTVGAGMMRGAGESRCDTTLAHTIDWQGFELELNGLIRKYFPHWEAKDIRDRFRS
ncbi:GTP-binding protein, partial [Halomonas sp. GXIMD04776]|uniref:GTP-binding protein n=1 Tax=Halomonas sp. GXIMD04776 TaxID=3415605 RepID=UPI003C8A4133